MDFVQDKIKCINHIKNKMQNDNNPFYDERGNLKIIDRSKQGLMKTMV